MIRAGGYTMANMIKINKTGIDRNWHIWYTGGIFEYVDYSDKKFHWTAGALIGGGSLSEPSYIRLISKGSFKKYGTNEYTHMT